MDPKLLAYVVCFLSGAAGLIYEVVWTRVGVLLFGATAPAMATVLACFMGGLGLGAHLGGRAADRTGVLLRKYAAVELSIGAWGLLLVLGQSFGSVGDLAVPSRLGMPGRIGVAALLLGIPTVAMGATLPLLVRFVSSALSAAHGLATLYAANTLGAVSGALLAGFLLLERMGLRGAQLVAVAFNVSVAAAAWTFSRRGAAGSAPREQASAPPAEPEPGSQVALAAAAILGMCSLALEVVLTRALDLFTYSTIYAFTAILAMFLVGIGLGSAACARRIDTLSSPRRTLTASIGVLAATTLWAPVMLAVLAVGYPGGSTAVGGVQLKLLVVAALVVLPPTLASGAAFPLLGRIYLSGRSEVGAGVGRLYLMNTVGCVVGSLAANFVLLPALGIQRGLYAIAAVTLGAAAWVGLKHHARVFIASSAAVAAVFGAIQLLGVDLSRDLYAKVGPEWRILETRDDSTASVMVAVSKASDARMGLWIDGSFVAGTGGAHLLLAHIPMLRHGAPKRVLGACMGTGQTFGATAEYPLERLDLVELTPSVVELARTRFARFDRGLFERDNVFIHLDDARRYIRSSELSYDVVTAEPLQPWTLGTVTLYSAEYYRQVAAHLRPGGIAVQWIPLYEVDPDDLRGIVATFQGVFPDAELWLDYRDLILIGGASLPALSVDAWRRELASPHVRRDLESIHLGDAVTLIGKRVLRAEALRRFARGGRVITDDRPYLEMTAPRAIGKDTEWANLRALVEAWDGGPGLADELRRAGEATREGVRVEIAEHEGKKDSTMAYLEALSRYPAHSQLFARAAGRVARDAQEGRPGALDAYRELLRLRPDYGKGWVNFGALLLDRGRPDEAKQAFDTAEALPSQPDEVRVFALVNLGIGDARAKRFAAARARFAEALRLRPGDPIIGSYLARLPPAN